MPSLPPLPPYTIRSSKRSKRITLRIRPHLGLEIVLPEKAGNVDIVKILEQFRPWIERHYPRIMRSSLSSGKRTAISVPQYFFLHGGKTFVAVGQSLQKIARGSENTPRQQHNEEKKKSFHGDFDLESLKHNTTDDFSNAYQKNTMPSQEIMKIKGVSDLPFPLIFRDINIFHLQLPNSLEKYHEGKETTAPHALFGYLRDWVRAKAKEQLSLMIKEESLKYELPYGKVTFRLQKTRWGSCSFKKNISLNACLIFLPEHLSRYIILHELCHTKVMNHSTAYWKLLFSLDNKALQHDKAMRKAWRYVPQWVMLSK